MKPQNSSSYFYNAVKEVALLVTGILIALLINNWNLERQEAKELKGYLRNIKRNLLSDQKTIEEIAIFRDSSIQYSKSFLQIADKEKVESDDINKIMDSQYDVFFDTYFKTRKSGFDALKNSGYIGKLNGTAIEENLNEYYYIVDKITAQEKSLYFTIESMENQVFIANIRQQLAEIFEMKDKENYINQNQDEILKLLNFPSLIAANNRNSKEKKLPMYYKNLKRIGQEIIREIE